MDFLFRLYGHAGSHDIISRHSPVGSLLFCVSLCFQRQMMIAHLLAVVNWSEGQGGRGSDREREVISDQKCDSVIVHLCLN
jgi:hypothetical protein